ncbi:MAG: methyltransferase domain-containing protein [Candidatus Eisenbacteria bacterium]|nr:methyltransferase domain-containing protein [Candidatus Eisenbacteria bacterium]
MNPHRNRYHNLISWPAPAQERGLRGFYRRLRRSYREKIVRKHVAVISACIAECGARRILEIGAGDGRVLGAVQRRHGKRVRIEGIDLPEARSAQSPEMPVRPMAAEHLAYRPGSFDLVYSVHTAEHLPDLDAVLSEVTRVLRPGGALLLIVPVELFRGSHAFMESLSLTGSVRRGFRLARRLHVRRVGPVARYRFATGALRLRDRRLLLERLLSPERVLIYERETSQAPQARIASAMA